MSFKTISSNGYEWGVLENKKVILDTVPLGFAWEWLESAPEADTLILCSNDQFPKTVEKFIEAHPEGRVYAPSYMLFQLKGIIGDYPNLKKASDKGSLVSGGEKLIFEIISQAEKSAYLSVYDQEDCYTGKHDSTGCQPVKYGCPTVAICYVSGCDYTETMAEKIAEGIRDSKNLETCMIDLASHSDEEAAAMMVNAEGILIGTPETDGDAHGKVWSLVNSLPEKLFTGKKASAFGNYTRKGRGVPDVIARLKEKNMLLLDGGFNLQYRPLAEDLKGVYEYGYAYGCALQNKPNDHQSTLVKCTVCGEIFDSSLGKCPVCGVGMDKCIPVYEETVGHKKDTNMVYLIAGGGIAAVSAAEAIRKRDTTGKIIMVSEEETLPINRPMLSKSFPLIAVNPENIRIKDASWFEKENIELRLGTSLTELRVQKKNALLIDGSTIRYDRLIYATGAECNVPPIKGKDKDGVMTIRHLKDVLEVRERLSTITNVVVIGGGVLGLEFASELKKMRARVTVLEMNERIMERQLDTETSEKLRKAVESFGITVVTGVNIEEITGDGFATGVKTGDGAFYPADFVVLSCGNKSNIQAASQAGIECGRAIKVNPFMETSKPDIYAAGDCCENAGVNYQLWAEAAEQGKVAGANAAGDRIRYKNVTYGTSFEGANISLFAIGDVGKGEKKYQIIEKRNEIEGSHSRYWFTEKKLCGGILFGDTTNLPFLTNAVVNGEDYIRIADML